MFLLITLVLLAASLGSACNDVILNDINCSRSVVSGRTFSFAVELSPRVTAGPPTAPLGLLDIAANTPSPFGRTIQVTYGFVCISHLPKSLVDAFPPSDPIRQNNHAVCIDGLNTAGLSVAVLYQEETNSMPEHSPQSSKTAVVNFLDLPAFLLARYSTVADVERDLHQNIQVVWSPRYNPLGQAVSFGTQDVPPLHVTLHDAGGASLVVQFKEGDMQVLRNPLGVFANQPFLQEQIQHYESWLSQHNLSTAANITGQHWPMPGDFSSVSRFTRMAMLKSATQTACWPTEAGGEEQHLSPGVVPSGYPADSPALLAVLGIMQSVYLPRGIDDDGAAGTRDPADVEATPYSTLRDHTTKTFYYRTGNSVLYRSVALNTTSWGYAGSKLSHQPLLPPKQPWVIAGTEQSLFVTRLRRGVVAA